MSKGAFEVAKAGAGMDGSLRVAEGAAAAEALMRPPLRPSRRDLNSQFSLESLLIGLRRGPPFLAQALSPGGEGTWISRF